VKHPVCTIVQQNYELLLFLICVWAERLARDDERAGAATDAVPRVRARGATNRTGSSPPARRRPCPEPDDDQRDTSTRPFWLWHTRHTHTHTRHVRPLRFPWKYNGRLGVVCEHSWWRACRFGNGQRRR